MFSGYHCKSVKCSAIKDEIAGSSSNIFGEFSFCKINIFQDLKERRGVMWFIPVRIVSMMQLEQAIWKSILKVKISLVRDYENAATTAGNLKRRVEINHKGVRYPCSECEYSAIQKRNLKKMKKINKVEKHLFSYCKHP